MEYRTCQLPFNILTVHCIKLLYIFYYVTNSPYLQLHYDQSSHETQFLFICRSTNVPEDDSSQMLKRSCGPLVTRRIEQGGGGEKEREKQKKRVQCSWKRRGSPSSMSGGRPPTNTFLEKRSPVSLP